MGRHWQSLFLDGLVSESDPYRLGDMFRENVARQAASDRQGSRKRTDLLAVTAPTQQAEEDAPPQVAEVVVTGRRPDWLHRQMSRARYGLEGFVNGRPSSGEAYYGLPSVQPTTPQEQAAHVEFIRQRDAFHALTRNSDHLQRNVAAARRNPGKYAGDVALGTLKGAGREGLNFANSALAGYALQHPEAVGSADAVNRLTGKHVFEVGRAPWGLPTVQISQPEGLKPRGDIQNQWSYLGRFGTLVGTGAATEVMVPARAVAPVYRPPRPPYTPNGQYYSVAYEAKLDPADWGRRASVHEHRANTQLDDDLASDAAWAAGMEEMIPGLRQSVSKVGRRETPNDWMWHHDGVARPGVKEGDVYGFLQLTPEEQHASGSIFSKTFHPDPRGRGGYAIWAVPAGAPRRR